MKHLYNSRHNDIKSSVIKVSTFTVFLLSLWLFAGTILQAQPTITSYSPSRNAVSATQSSNIVLGWNTTLNALVGGVSGTNATIIIRGSQSATYYSVGATITGGGTNTATVNPTNNLKAGELITVTVTGATSTGNVPMALPQVYQFRAKVPTLAGLYTGTGTVDVGTWPRRVSLGDVNGDGHLDIIGYSAGDNGAVGSGTVQIHTNNGSGTFTAGQFITGLNGSRSGEIGDVDGDGDLDIVLTAHTNNSLLVLQNNGSGTFTTLSTLALGVQAGYPLLFDADGDGDLDVVMIAGNDLYVRLNDGAGNFSGSYSVGFGGGGPWMINYGDVDNDGDLDVIVPRFANSDVVVMLNNGNGTFTNGGSFGIGNEPLAAALGDIDGDGDLDLVAANGGSANSVSVRLNNGSGSFSGSSAVSVGSGTHFVQLADVDGNGTLDILTANYGAGTVSVRYNNGSGSFSGTQDVSMAGAGAIVSVETGDIDGDGDLDFITGCVNDSKVGIRFNTPRPVPVVTIVSPSRNNKSVLRDANVIVNFTQNVTGVTAGNIVIRGSQTGALYSAGATISGNGSESITVDPSANFKIGETVTVTVTNASTALMQPMLTSHTYSFVAKSEVGPMVFTSTNTAVGSLPISVATGDVDNDGDLDVVVANNTGGNSLSVRLNNGSGTFTNGATLSTPNPATCVALGDVNGDGHLDVVASSASGGNWVNVYMNNGNSTFAGGVSYDPGSTAAPTWVALADFDGDRDLDIVTANNATNTNTISVLYNNGNGTFTFPGYVPLGTGAKPYAVTVGDVDNDGDVDIVSANQDGNNVSVFYNNGFGSFPTRVNFATGTGANAVQLADLDGDGDADMITSDRNANTVSVLFNDGAGNFSGLTAIAVGTAPRTLVTGDFDGDGDLDAAVANQNSNSISLLTNNGSGVFSAHSTLSTASQPLGLAIGDMDGNGSLDMVTTNFGGGSASILLNRFAPPTITSISPSSGVAGDVVTVTGTDFTGATSVTIGGQPVYSFWVSSATTITAVVGSGISGNIEVRTTTGTAVSPTSFTVNSGGVSSQPVDVSRIVLGQTSFTGTASGQSSSNLLNPFGVAVDPTTGKVFVADELNSRVLRYASYQNLTNGAAAEAVLGQPDFATVSAGTTAAKMARPRGIFVDGSGRLWVADLDNSRVLRFDNASGISSGASANGVLGQANFTSAGFGEAANQLRQPSGVFVDGGGRLWVADMINNRVLRYDNAAAKSNGANADGLLGQTGFGLSTNLTTRAGMMNPMSVWVDGAGRLWVGEQGNRRVLRFDNAASKANSADADGVLGKTDYVTNTLQTTQNGMSAVLGVTVDGSGRLWVSDMDNNRVLWFDNAAAKSNGANADGVIGQSNYTTSAASSIQSPRSVFANRDGLLWIVEHNSHRVIAREYVAAPVITSFTPTSGSGGTTVAISGNNFNEIIGVKIGGQPVYRFWVNSTTSITAVVGSGVTGTIEVIGRAKSGTSVGQFTVTSAGVFANPVNVVAKVIGQANFVSSTAGNTDLLRSQGILNFPQGSAIDPISGHIWVTDVNNHRVLRFASYASYTNGAAPQVVLGQPDISSGTANNGGISGARMNEPISLYIDGAGHLWVAERLNHRVLRFNNASTLVTGASANGVLGQADFTSGSANRGGSVAANTLNHPQNIFVDGAGTLWVTDTDNHRVLRFDNAAAKAHGANADGVLGQLNFTSAGANTGGISGTTFQHPFAVTGDGKGALWVADAWNNRVLRFDNAAIKSNGGSADGVLGQINFTAGLANRGGSVAANTINYPSGLSIDGAGRLWVVDLENHRVLGYNNAHTIANGSAADYVFGQPSFTVNSVNNGGISANTLSSPRRIATDAQGRLLITDAGNNRVLAMEYVATFPPTISSVSSTSGTWSDGNILSTTGHTVTLTGTNLGELTAVRFFGESGITGVVSSSNATQAVVQVPSGISVTSGSIRVVNIAGGFTTTAVLAIVAPPSISNISPLSVAVGDTLTVSGQNFQYVTTARIFGAGGVTGVIASRSGSQLRVVVPTGTSSQGNVYVENIAGASSANQQVTIVQTPTISSVSSTSGTWSDGNILSTTGHTVTLTGTNLGALTAVRFFGESGVTGVVSSSNATQVVVQVPLGINITSGSIRVVNIAGGFTTTAVLAIVAPPSISSVSQLSVAVGDTLTVSGQNFQYVTTARIFGAGGVTGVIASRSGSQLRVVVPTGTASQGNVYVENIAGASSANQQVTIVQTPTISSVSSTSGTWSDGNILSTTGHTVTLTGTNLGALTAVRFFGESGVTGVVSSSNATQVVVQVPSGISVTSGSIRVVNIAGGFTTTAVLAIVAPPSISNVSPLFVQRGGLLTINGDNLQYIQTAKTFGVNGANAQIQNRSHSEISIVIPSNSLAQGFVYLENIAGTTLASQSVSVVDFPILTGITPARVHTGGTVQLTGFNLQFLSEVRFFGAGGILGEITSTSSTIVSVRVPSSVSAASGRVFVRNISGTTQAPTDIEIVFSPVISSVSAVKTATGQTLTITGQHLQYIDEARFFGMSGVLATVQSSSATQLVLTVPTEITATSGSIYVKNIGGNTLSSTVEIVSLPVVQSIVVTPQYVGAIVADPQTSTPLIVTGGTITLQGSNLADVTAVRFFGNSGVSGTITSKTPTNIVVQVPVNITSGSGQLWVENLAGGALATPSVTIMRQPIITNITPLLTATGQTVSISGQDLAYSTDVRFFGESGIIGRIVSTSATVLQVEIPASASAISGQVWLRNVAGTALSAQTVELIQVPNIVSVSTLITGTGATFTITGTNLANITEVRFFGMNGALATVQSSSATQLVVTVPTGISQPSGFIYLRNLAGTTLSPQQISLVAPPVISSVEPTLVAVGGLITLQGENLQNLSSVRFFGATGVEGTIQSNTATRATVTVPSGISATSGQIYIIGQGGAALSAQQVEIFLSPTVSAINILRTTTGATLTLTGTSLNRLSEVRFFGATGVQAVIQSSSATQAIVVVPSGITSPSGKIYIANAVGNSESTQLVTIIQPPVISSVTPLLSATGASITITGQHLDDITQARFFAADGTVAVITSSSATQLALTVPTGLLQSKGTIFVTNISGTAFSAQEVEIIAPPVLGSPNKLRVAAGDTIIFNGSNLANITSVRFFGASGTVAEIVNKTATQITVRVPTGISLNSGFVWAENIAGNVLATQQIEIIRQPIIASVTPAVTTTGATVTVTGEHLQYITSVEFIATNTVAATVTGSSTATQIAIQVPAGLIGATAQIRVRNIGGTAESAPMTLVRPPVITTVTPNTSRVGYIITLTGENLQHLNAVRFFGATGVGGQVLSSSATQAVVKVPSGITVTSGNIYVENIAGSTLSPETIIQLPLPLLVYWSNGTSIAHGDINTPTNISANFISGLQSPRGIFVDVVNGYIYWADEGNNRIGRANIDGNNRQDNFVTGISSPRDVFVNNELGYIYWINGGTNTIGRAQLSNIATTIQTNFVTNLGTPSAMAYDAGYFYVSDASGNSIRRVEVTGGGATVFIPAAQAGFNPQGVAVQSGTLYWCAPNEGIRRRLVSGGTVETIVPYAQLGSSAAQGVTLFDGKVYWADVPGGRIRRANTDGTTVETIFNGVGSPRFPHIGRDISSTPPMISSFTPTTAWAGAQVTINGVSFKNQSHVLAVRFGGEEAQYVVLSDTQISATVGAGATGTVSVQTLAGGASLAGFTFVAPPTITNISPLEAAVGLPITITGTNLNLVTAVRFFGTSGVQTTSFVQKTATQLVVNVPAGASGQGFIALIAESGNAVATQSLRLLEQPTISAVTPLRTTTGASVTISGSNLDRLQQVRFFSSTGVQAIVQSSSATQVVVSVPAGISVPTGFIHVANIAGSTSSTQAVTLIQPPVITAISTTETIVGDTVLLSGSDFAEVSAVKFFGSNGIAASFAVTGAQLRAVVPIGTAGMQGRIHLTNPAGTVLSDNITVLAVPSVTEVNPVITKAGDTIRLSGTHLGAVNSVRFFGTTGVEAVISQRTNTLIDVVVPNGAAGSQGQLFVSNRAGSILAPSVVTVVAPPQITSVTPAFVEINDTLTITGTHLGNIQTVRLFGSTGTVVTPLTASQNQIKLLVPRSVAGTSGKVFLQNIAGNVLSVETITVAAPLQITGISPTLLVTGNTLTLDGTGLNRLTTVRLFGNIGALATIQSKTATRATVTVPSGITQRFGQLFATDGIDEISPTTVLEVLSAPVINAVNNNITAREQLLTLTGDNLQHVTEVRFFGESGVTASIISQNQQQLIVRVPTASSGAGAVFVRNAAGTALSPTVTIMERPLIQNVSPLLTVQGASVILTGEHFANVDTVRFFGATGIASSITAKTATSITVVVPSGVTPAVGNVYIRNLAGSTLSQQQIEIVAQPVITSVTPLTVVTGGTLTISGNNLQHVNTVRFFGVAGVEASITSKTATSITVTVPVGISTGSGNVHISNIAGSALSGQVITIARVPIITSVSPVLTITTGSVVLQGENLNFVDTVRFFGASGVAGFIQQKSAQSLTVTVPAGITQRSGNIVITGIAGTATAPTSIEIVAPPIVNTVSSLFVKRGDTITISGMNLRHVQRVRFFGNAGAEATIVEATETSLRCIVPNNHVGRNGVLVLENIAGTAQSAQTVEVVLPPSVQSVSALMTTVGASLTISGNELQHVDTVRFFGAGGGSAVITNRTATQLVVTVPSQTSSTSGQLYIANIAGNSLSPQTVEVVRQPVLTGVSATRVAIGNTLILQGQELQQIQTVRFFGATGATATIVSKNNTQLSVLVPNNASARSGRVWVSNIAGNTETPQTVDIVATPTISGLSRTLTFTGATVTISGNELQHVDTVRFFGTTGVSAVISAQTQTSITVTVPSGITVRSGAIRVSNVAGAAVSGQISEIVSSPVINTVSRTLTATGATLTFYGRELQHVDTVRFFGTSGIAANIINKNSDSLSVTVPSGITARQGTVYVANIAGNTVSPTIEIARLPIVTSVSETLTVSGATITLAGDELQHVDTVRFFGNVGALATISSKAQNSLTVVVPNTATARSGNIYVANNAGGSTSPVIEIARQPIITGVSAVRTITGATLSLTGDELQHIDTVRFFGTSGVAAIISSKTQNSLSVTVPSGITIRQGQIFVRSRAGTALSANVAIVSQPVITSITPASVQQGGVVEIIGQNLEAIDTIRFFGNSGTATDIIEQTSTMLRVKVPILPSDTVGLVFVKNIAGTALAPQTISIIPAPLALYWSNRTAQAVGRLPMNSPQTAVQNFINGTGSAQGLAVDMVRGYIYWAQGDTAIGRANLDGSGVNTSFIGGLQNIRSVAVDAQNSMIYWGTAQGALGRAQIQATGATGVNQSFATSLGNITSIAVSNSDIYTADQSVNVIRRVAKANGATSVAVQTATVGLQLGGIAVHQDELYWYSQTGIRRASLTGANAATLIPASTLAGRTIQDIAVFGNRLYWGEINLQRISTMPIGGGAITTFAANISAPYNLVIGSNPAVPSPTISDFTPATTWQGGEVIINGTGFRNQVNTYAVQFGDIPAASFTVESDTRIRAIVSTGATGSIEVQTLGGSARVNGFTFVQGPSVTSVSAERTITGATIVVNGNNLQYINSVRFFGTTGVQGVISQQSTTAVHVVVPSGITTASGVIMLSGNSGTAQTQTIEIVAPPLVSSVSTTLTQAGAQITLAGTNLQYINTVRFFGTTGTPATVISSTATMLQVIVPSGLGATSGRVAVSNIAGVALAPIDIEIALAPVISTLSETLRTTGETLTITGSNLAYVTSVRLFGANGTQAQFTVVSPTQITVTVPSGITQREGTVYVQNFVGGTLSAQVLRLVQAPVITGVQPASALPGAVITMNGDDFERIDEVRFFGVTGVLGTIISKTRTELQVSVPFGTSTDRGQIYVRNSIGNALSPLEFRIVVPPVVSGIEPVRAPANGIVSIYGANLADVNNVRFFGASGVQATILSATRDTLRVRVPVGVVADSGLLHIANSAGSTSATQTFTVIRPPVIDSIVPLSNVVGGNISLFGNNFTDVTEVRFFGADGVIAQIVGRTANRLDVIVPSGITQEVGSIRVINPAGFANSPQFRLILVPSITAITPEIAAPGATITITGQRLADITSVRFFGTSGVEGTIVSSSLTELRVVVPQGIQTASGFIRVANLAGATNAPMVFSLMPPTVVTAITPLSGLPGSVVTITGQNLQYIDTVRFFGETGSIAEIIIKNATTLQARVPAASSAETGALSLRSAVGTVQTPAFRVILQPVITGIEPLRAPVNALVTIRGRRFLDHSAVRFFGQSAASVISFTDSTIQVRVPAAQANFGTIQVVNPAGTATSGQTFTIIRQPVITAVAPVIAPIGDTITITGDHLVDVTEVRFFGAQGVTSAIISQTATGLRVRVPGGTSTFSGSIAVINSAGQALVPFNIMRPPTVTGITPLRGVQNNRITITGTNLADVTEVRFFGPNGILATIEERQAGSLRVVVPAQQAQAEGTIFLRNKAGNVVSTQQFGYIQLPIITAITPAEASPNAIITLTGQFEAVSQVRFFNANGLIGQIISATATELRVRVPASSQNVVGRIFVFNPRGVAQSPMNFSLILPTPPQVPLNLAWENITDFTMTATWNTPVDKFPAVSYQVAIFEWAFVGGRWQAVNVGQVVVPNTGANKLSHTFSNLKQGVNYYFGVRGWNSLGFGAPVYSAWGKTLDSRPGAPFTPAVNQITPTSVKVKWVNVSVGGTPQLFRAQVFRNGVLPTGTPEREVTVNVPSDSIVVTGLQEDTDYYYRIRAENSFGSSGWVQSAVFRTERDMRRADSLALVTLFSTMNGNGWIQRTNWLSDRPLNEWFGVTVQNNRVVEIVLPMNNLQGTMPANWGERDLTELRRLILWGNRIGGSTPSSMRNWTKLNAVELDNNQFSGFGTDLTNLRALRVLRMDNNQLTVFPPQLLQMATNDLRVLRLDRNRISSIVSRIENFPQLRGLWLNKNGMTGTLMGNFVARMPFLESVFLNGNQLTDVPDIRGIQPLRQVLIQNNRLASAALGRNAPLTGRNEVNYISLPQSTLVKKVITVYSGDNVPLMPNDPDVVFGYRWYYNDTLIADIPPGEDGSHWIVNVGGKNSTGAGEYRCEMYVPEFSRVLFTSDIIDVVTLNSGQEPVSVPKESSIVFYPNPADNIVNVEFTVSSAEPTILEVFDATGKMVMQTMLAGKAPGRQTTQLEVQHLPIGSYQLIIRNGREHMQQTSFIIMR